MHLHPAGSLLWNGFATRPHMGGAEHTLYLIKLRFEKKKNCYYFMHLKNISTLILINKKYCKLMCYGWQYYLHDGNMVTTFDDTYNTWFCGHLSFSADPMPSWMGFSATSSGGVYPLALCSEKSIRLL